MSDKKSESTSRPPQLPTRGEPIRVKTITFDASQAVTVPGMLVNTISYDPDDPVKQNWEVWYMPAIAHFWIKNHHKKYDASDAVLVHVARVAQWIPLPVAQ